MRIFFQLRNGKRLEHSCREGETFAKILEDFLASASAVGVNKTTLRNPPRLVFDGEVLDLAKQTPKQLDMEDEDMLDLQ